MAMPPDYNERIRKVVEHWTETADQDYRTAQILFEKERYAWCLFLVHLVLEKLLKALWAARRKEATPPRTHNLLRLAEMCQLGLSEEDKTILLEITEFNIEARYPETEGDFYKTCTKEFAERYLGIANQWREKLLEQLKRS